MFSGHICFYMKHACTMCLTHLSLGVKCDVHRVQQEKLWSFPVGNDLGLKGWGGGLGWEGVGKY